MKYGVGCEVEKQHAEIACLVGDQENRLVFQQTTNTLAEQMLTNIRINSRERVVQNEDRCIRIHGASCSKKTSTS
jgi:hypothetical protein